MLSQFGTSPSPPLLLVRLVLRDQLVPEDQPEFTRVGSDQRRHHGPQVRLVQGQRQLHSTSPGPEVSRVVVKDLGRTGRDGGATEILPHRLGSAAPCCLPHYSGE